MNARPGDQLFSGTAYTLGLVTRFLQNGPMAHPIVVHGAPNSILLPIPLQQPRPKRLARLVAKILHHWNRAVLRREGELLIDGGVVKAGGGSVAAGGGVVDLLQACPVDGREAHGGTVHSLCRFHSPRARTSPGDCRRREWRRPRRARSGRWSRSPGSIRDRRSRHRGRSPPRRAPPSPARLFSIDRRIASRRNSRFMALTLFRSRMVPL